ncbi:HD domain-containing protein [Kitasatospora sp. LaBMicrA B282]|uniref:HD domain-containing protein n=1 Tax=Kitasatospora sp. LaBMicrA B282 TaxID=3420949 RepID=UPI003D0F7169
MNEILPEAAWHIAEQTLAESLPRRWAHSQGVARQAGRLAPVLGPDAPLLASAAVLHDVGYAPELAVTGFHPLDGARNLRDVHRADDRLTRLVANHSFALLEADLRGIRPFLESEFPLLEDQVLVDALVYCDMTTTPDGEPTTSQQRITEITGRYGGDSVVGRFIRQAEPLIHTAVARTEDRIAVAAVQPR